MVVFIMGAVLAIITGYSALMTREAANNLARNQEAYLSSARAKITKWYSENAATIDASGTSVPTQTQIFDGAVIVPEWNLKAAASMPLLNGNISYRVIAIWCDNGGTQSSFDAANGTFVPGSAAKYVLVNGLAIETRKTAQSVSIMNTIAALLQQRFYTKYMADGGQDLTVNYFRPADPACNVVGDEIPCTDQYPWEPATDMNLDEILGMKANQLVNAWGIPILLCNASACGANISSPPYTMLVQSNTPWGTSNTVVATQPL